MLKTDDETEGHQSGPAAVLHIYYYNRRNEDGSHDRTRLAIIKQILCQKGLASRRRLSGREKGIPGGESERR